MKRLFLRQSLTSKTLSIYRELRSHGQGRKHLRMEACLLSPVIGHRCFQISAGSAEQGAMQGSAASFSRIALNVDFRVREKNRTFTNISAFVNSTRELNTKGETAL